MTVFWSLVAAASAVLMEYLYRTLPGPWWHWVWIWTPLALVISYAICFLVRTPGIPLVGALIIWSLAVMGMRVFVTTVILGDTVALGTWIALGLMICARFAQQVWR